VVIDDGWSATCPSSAGLATDGPSSGRACRAARGGPDTTIDRRRSLPCGGLTGWQVTYAGHPLYLFDQMPGAVTGQGWFEPGLPPWHGIWWLMSASGQPAPWAGTLTTTKIGGKTVLAESYLTGIGWINFPLYTFSGDQSSAVCSANPACARAWPPVLTSGATAYVGVPASGVGEIGIPGQLTQVTWNGQPLYLFSHEQLMLLSNGAGAPEGNGNGIKAFGGTFSLVVNP